MNTKIVAQPALYQPSRDEIAHVVESAKRRHCDSATRIDKARDILVSGSLTIEPIGWEVRNVVRWHVCSQTHAKAAYVVVGVHCPCQDSRAPLVGTGAHRARFCKHAMAVSLYSKILRNHLNADIRRREIDLGILPDGSFNSYASRLGICRIRKSGQTYDFADAASMVRYSLWLAQPVAVEWPVAVPVAAINGFNPDDIIER